MRQPIILITPAEASRTDGVLRKGSAREFFKCDAILAALTQAAGPDVSVVERPSTDVPEDGFLLVFEGAQLEQMATAGPRIIYMFAERGEVWAGRPEHMITEKYRLAGAVEWGEWFHGLVSVAARAGMEVTAHRSSSNYGALRCSNHCKNLPELLVHYLTVYEEMGLHLRDAVAP